MLFVVTFCLTLHLQSVLVSRMSQGDVPPSTLEDFRRDILGMSKRLYQLHPAKDVLFEAARLLMAIKDFQGALKLFVASENACGAHYVTHHNKGMCYFYLGQLQPALDAFDSCLKIQPDYDDAKHWSAHAKKVLYTTTSESS
jgi:tetratricopeptide (TPR) repeat protein